MKPIQMQHFQFYGYTRLSFTLNNDWIVIGQSAGKYGKPCKPRLWIEHYNETKEVKL